MLDSGVRSSPAHQRIGKSFIRASLSLRPRVRGICSVAPNSQPQEVDELRKLLGHPPAETGSMRHRNHVARNQADQGPGRLAPATRRAGASRHSPRVSGGSCECPVEVGVDPSMSLARIDDSIYDHVLGRGVWSTARCAGHGGGTLAALRIR